MIEDLLTELRKDRDFMETHKFDDEIKIGVSMNYSQLRFVLQLVETAVLITNLIGISK